MSMTDEQFDRGLRAAVEKKGNGHVALATYWDRTGSACCIVAVALEEAGQRENIPFSNLVDATTLLPELGVSQKIAHAARAAQVVQDRQYNWGTALAAYEEVLSLWTSEADTSKQVSHGILRSVADKYPSKTDRGFSNSVVIKKMEEEIKALTEALNASTSKMMKEKPTISIELPKFTGGLVTGGYATGGVVLSSNDYNLISDAAYAGLMKKDHALTA
jgi:hypothetical protein